MAHTSLPTTEAHDISWQEATTPRPKTRRVRTGCLTCRARKIKCDETTGGCTNCRKRLLACDYMGADHNDNSDVAPHHTPLSSSTTASCQQCRTARSKCTRTRPQCTRCGLRNLPCAYREASAGEDGLRLTATARQRIELAKRRGGERRRRTASLARDNDSETPGSADRTWQLDERRDQIQVQPSVEPPHRDTILVVGEEAPGRIAEQSTSQDPLPVPLPVRPIGSSCPSNVEALPDNIVDYVNAFFEYVAPYQANAFLHRGLLRQQMRDGQASDTLLLAICAITARFVDDSASSSTKCTTSASMRSRTWARTAACHCIFAHNITLDKAMAALLLCKNAAYSGDFSQAFLLAAVANRFALKLRLFDEQRWSDGGNGKDKGGGRTAETAWVQAEQKRRVMFACYSVDRATATGLAELTFCPAASMRLPLPSEDYNFDLNIPCKTPVPALEADDLGSIDASYEHVGIMGQYVALVGIRYMILRYIESLSDYSNADTNNCRPPWDPESDYFLCLRKLAQWSTSLPPRFHLTHAVLFHRHHTPHYHLGPLVMLHLWHDMLHCELYRLALQTHAEQPHLQVLFQLAPPGWLDQTQGLCVLHARRMVQTLQTVEEVTADGSAEAGVTILDPSLSMLCYASAKIQLMYPTAALSPPSAADDARDAADRVEQFRILLLFVERLARFYAPASFLLREIKHNLQQCGIAGPWSEPTVPTAGTQTPDHPWFARLRGLDQPSPPDFYWGLEDVDLLSDALHASDISLFNQVTGVPEWLR